VLFYLLVLLLYSVDSKMSSFVDGPTPVLSASSGSGGVSRPPGENGTLLKLAKAWRCPLGAHAMSSQIVVNVAGPHFAAC
jgi:hypothetical protein